MINQLDLNSPVPPSAGVSDAAAGPAQDSGLVQELLRSLYGMAALVEARDPYTGGHLWRVSQYSKLLAQHAALPSRDVARISIGAFLHDLGKIAVPDAILNKHGPLTDEEFAIIKTHPEVGWRLLVDHPLASLVREAVYSHHERIDGGGYPQGLRAEQLSVDARVVGISDAYDAMTSTRPYRKGMPTAVALEQIQKNLGRQFDSELGSRFVGLGQGGQFGRIQGHSDHGIPLQDCPECGPIIVIRRDQEPGDQVFCRNCGYQTTILLDQGLFRLAESEMHGQPRDLQPDIDRALIQELVAVASTLL